MASRFAVASLVACCAWLTGCGDDVVGSAPAETPADGGTPEADGGEPDEEETCAPAAPLDTPAAECASGRRFDGPDSPEGRGVCLPDPPRGTPAGECPSERFHEGVCVAQMPAFPEMVCPTGWRSETLAERLEIAVPAGGDTTVCSAVVDGACGPFEVALPSARGCAPLARDCEALGDGWLEPEAIRDAAPGFDGPILYVAPTGHDDGAGERAEPLASLGTAVARAQPGTIIALSAGVWQEPVELSSRVAIVGVCPAVSAVESVADDVPAVDVRGDGVHLARLSMRGPKRAFRAIRASNVALRGVLIEGSLRALEISGGEVDVALAKVVGSLSVKTRASVSFRQVQLESRDGSNTLDVDSGGTHVSLEDSVVSSPPDAQPGRGMTVTGGATMELRHVLIERVHTFGAVASGAGSTRRVEQSHLRAIAQRPGGGSVAVTGAIDGGGLEARQILIDNDDGIGVLIRDEGSQGTVSDAVIVRGPNRGTLHGSGITVAGTAAEVSRVIIATPRETGVSVQGNGQLSAADMLIFGHQPRGLDASRAVNIQENGHLDAHRVAVLGTVGIAMSMVTGGTMTGADLTLSDSSRVAIDHGYGLSVTGGSASVTRLTVERNAVVGATLQDSGELHIVDLVAVGHNGLIDGDEIGVAVFADVGRFSIDRGIIDDANHVGVRLSGGVRAELTDLSVVGVGPTRPETVGGGGIEVSGAELVLRRVQVRDARLSGVHLVDVRGDLEDVSVTATVVVPAQKGAGFSVREGSDVRGRRVLVDDNDRIGLAVAELATVEFTDLVVSGTTSWGDIQGIGVVVLGASLSIARGRLFNNRTLGLLLSNAAHAELVDTVIEDTQPQLSDNFWGRGASIEAGSELVMRRVIVRGSYQVGLLVSTSTLDASDLSVEATQRAACAPNCPNGFNGGIGLGAYQGATATLRNFSIHESASVGLQVDPESGLDAACGLISANGIGINLQGTRDEENTVVHTDVRIVGNGREWAGDALPTPTASDIDL